MELHDLTQSVKLFLRQPLARTHKNEGPSCKPRSTKHCSVRAACGSRGFLCGHHVHRAPLTLMRHSTCLACTRAVETAFRDSVQRRGGDKIPALAYTRHRRPTVHKPVGCEPVEHHPGRVGQRRTTFFAERNPLWSLLYGCPAVCLCAPQRASVRR